MLTTDTRLATLARRTLTLAAILALTAGLPACESSGAAKHTQSPAARAAATPVQTEDYTKFGYRLEWRGFPTMLPGEHITQLEILGDTVVAQESAGVVSVLEARSGTTRWSDQVAGRLTKFVGILRNNDRLLVSSESDLFFYEIASGTLKNRQHLDQVVNTKPVQVGDVLVYGCANGQVLGHLLMNGFRGWATGLGGSIETPGVLTSTGRVAIVSTTGEFVILDGMSGLSQGRNRMFSGPGAPIGQSDTTLFIASMDNSLYAYAVEGGQQVWRKRTGNPLSHAPVYFNGRVYCDLGNAEPNTPRAMPSAAKSGIETIGGLTCLDAANGRVVWANPKVSGQLIGTRNKRLVVWNAADSTVYTLQPDDGVIVESIKLPGTSMLKTDNFLDGNLYTATTSGIISKLAPK